MSLTNKHIEQIERYLDSKMTEEEIISFEVDLKSDEELKRAFELEKKLRQGISASAREELSQKVKDIDKRLEKDQFFDQNKPTGMNKTIMYITAAAALLILIFAITYIMKPNGNGMTAEEIYATYYKVDPESLRERAAELRNLEFAAEETGRKDSLSSAIQKIEQGEYEEARDLLNDLISKYPGDPEAFYYAGLNQLQLGNYANAISKLQIARNAEDKSIRDRARYYFALCALMLKDGDKDNIARREFERIAEDETSEYQEVARHILEELETK